MKLALISNTESILTRHDLDVMGLSGVFDVIILSSDVGVAKPESAIFNIALDRLCVDARQAAMVGDTRSTDVDGARAAGIASILLDSSVPRGTVQADNSASLRVFPDMTSILCGLRKIGGAR